MKKIFLILISLLWLLINCYSQEKNNNIQLEKKQIKRILVLNAYHESYHWTDRIMSGIKSVFDDNTNTELFINYLDTKRCSDSTHFELTKELLRNKYKRISFDAILSTDDHALNFLLKYRDTLFPNVPVVFCGINDFTPKRIEGHYNFTGVYETYDVKGTIDLILNLHPNTKKIAVISDATHSGNDFKGRVERAEKLFNTKLAFEYLTNFSPTELETKLGSLNKETVVIWSVYLRKPDGVSISCEQSVKFISEATKQPVYCVWDVVGQGVVGGKITNPKYQGSRAGEIAFEILNGKPVSDFPVEGSPTVFKFDYKRLQKFSIPENKLPKNSIIINKPFSFYQTYQVTIWTVVGIMIFLIVCIAFLLRLNRVQNNAKKEISIKNKKLHENNVNLSKAKKTAEENELKLKLIADNFVNGMLYQVALIDENKRKFNYLSDAVNKLYNCTAEEAMVNPDLIYGKLHPEDIVPLIEKEQEALKNMSIFKAEARVINSDGSIRWAYYISKPRIIDGIACWDGVEVDITERKKLEIELLNAKEKAERSQIDLKDKNKEYEALNEELKQTNEELYIAKEKAEESDRLKTEFINNMSHEIRTPMNGILGFSKLLYKENLSSEKRIHYTNIVQNSGHQLMRVIDDILEISKLGTKQVKLSEKEICLNDLLLEHFSIFDIKAKENKTPLYLKKGLPDTESIIFTDKTKLNKTLSNLLENAIKFTNQGYIEFGYTLKNNAIEIYVKDTGIGINPDKQEAIFERFSQEEKELSKNVGGLGLGLSIAKENAQLLGGDITISSEKGKGSTFFVTIPYKPANKELLKNNGGNSTEKNLTEQNKYTILIVEDEEVNYLFIETLLEDEINLDCTIIHAKNGREAIEICQENQEIDFVLMDLKMPILNGFEATKHIKKMKPDLPIIAQSAYTTDEDKEKAFSAGCDNFISKPISEEKFNEITNKYLINK